MSAGAFSTLIGTAGSALIYAVQGVWVQTAWFALIALCIVAWEWRHLRRREQHDD